MTPAQLARRIRYVTEVRNHRAELERVRQERAMYRAAWICSTVMNMAGRQMRGGATATPEKLIVKRKTPDEINEARRQLIKRHQLDERFGIFEN